MPLPGDGLTSAHRAEQVRTAALLAARLRRRYAGLDLSSIQSQRNFLDLAVEDVVRARKRSTDLSVVYLEDLQRLEAPDGLVVNVEPGPGPNLEQIRRSLAFMGIAQAQQRAARVRQQGETRRERDLEAARRDSAAGVMGAGIRHAQNGARETTDTFVKRDRRARGWVRVTAGDEAVCYLCAMLASRVNYTDGSFDDSDAQFEGPGTAKVHDSCRCHLRPFYGILPDETMRYKDLWRDLSGAAIDGTNRGALKNFRSQWERRQRRLVGDEDESIRVA